ncbi:MAG: efflux RND transporter permease subunit, partial [Bacteroidales bacterium]|nr:efflux RND transporter permease subunit [Bacteroidales bacterium]
MAERNHRFSPFSVILIMIALSVVGIASLPLLNIQHKPSSGTKSISVSFSYPGASAEIVEGAVTCKIEGVLSGIMGNTGISSVSRKGTGTVTVDFGKDTDMAAAR